MIPTNLLPDAASAAMTSSAQETVATQNQPTLPPEARSAADKKRHDQFRTKIDLCKGYRRKIGQNWAVSIDYRRGKPFASQTDDDTIAVNLDWSFVKAKQAALFSQVPQVRVAHMPQSVMAGAWLATFERKLNDNLVVAGIEAAMDECLPDCINAAGFGVDLVSYESITEDKEVPSIDFSTLPPALAMEALKSGMIGGVKVPMETVPQVLDRRYVVQRISPVDFLWPLNFTSSNFDNAPWLGRSGRVTWSEALQKFKVLKVSDKEKVLGEDKTAVDRLTFDVDKDKDQGDELVGFDEIFYKEISYDPEAKSFSTIHHLVFVTGMEIPVIDEPWKGQRVDESGTVVGARKFPIRVFTLVYVTDETIPPSDSAIARPQVNEINKARTQMIRQRERNIPVRWFNVNGIDPAIQQSLMKGTWQNMIPVQGDGSRFIGEVARAAMPSEDFAFDKIAKSDLSESFGYGPNQLGSGENVETKGESGEIASNFQTRIGRERAKVAAHFVSIAEVLGGLMCLYEDQGAFGEGFDPMFSTALSYSILADSTVLVDSNQRLARLNEFIDKYAKSGWVVLEPVLKEVATLVGLDPNVVIKAPEPKPPVEPNISLRLTGAEDMMNPLMLAFMMKSGQAPPQELIEQAKALIQQAVLAPQPPPAPAAGAMPQGPPPGLPPGGVPAPAPPGVGEANPEMTILPTLDKRSEGNQA